MIINRGSTIANANSQITEKLFTKDFMSQAENKSDRKVNGWKFIALCSFVPTSIRLMISLVLIGE